MWATISGALAVIIGLVCLFDKTFMWELTHLTNLLVFRRESERTKAWEWIVNIGGALFLAFGVFLLFVTL